MLRLAVPLVLLPALALIWRPPPASAAPYCLATQWDTSCDYADYYECTHDAVARNAVCIANPKTEGGATVVGDSRFCVVEGSRIDCRYDDRQACRDAVAKSGGACIARP